MRRTPRKFFAIAALIVTLVVGIALWYWLRPSQFFWFWLLLSGIVTFLFYSFDKAQSKRGGWRVPEIVLHGMSLLGGFIGAALGMALWRHKTRKPLFLIVIILSGLLWFGGYLLL